MMTIYPVVGTAVLKNGVITLEVCGRSRRGTIHIRPRNKDPELVLKDLEKRANDGKGARIDDISWPDSPATIQSAPYAYLYLEMVGGKKTRSEPDPDGDVLRYHERQSGVR